MDRFLHVSQRLYTDLGRTTRFFLQPQQLSRWLCQAASVSEDGKGLILTAPLPDLVWEWQLLTVKREEYLEAAVTDFLTDNSTRRFQVEVCLMKCTSKTEYCSEIHLIQRGFGETEDESALRGRYLAFWQEKLEALRQHVNGKWVIEDRDLTLDLFR